MSVPDVILTAKESISPSFNLSCPRHSGLLISALHVPVFPFIKFNSRISGSKKGVFTDR